MSVESTFLKAVAQLNPASQDMQPAIAKMEQWLVDLGQTTVTQALSGKALAEQGALAQSARQLNQQLQEQKEAWAASWSALAPAQELADRFRDRIMLLVFGSFNAGKSSLCNFLADRFRRQGHSVDFFRLADGQMQPMPEGFQEGATETTVALQGVCLGEKLVLLDTPGLHSANAHNAALTQQFLESTDALLWLSSSSAPGQVQELGDLLVELRRNKPLLPVITRSDRIEEDEIDDEIVKVLCNKTADNRQLQEEDVMTRAAQALTHWGLSSDLLKPALSLSVHMARSQQDEDQGLEQAGFERLYLAVQNLLKPALAYKQRKPAELQLHHIEEAILSPLTHTLEQAATQLRQRIEEQTVVLQGAVQALTEGTWRRVVPQLSEVLEKHAAQQDVAAVRTELGQNIGKTFAELSQTVLANFQLTQPDLPTLNLPAHIGYEVFQEQGEGQAPLIDFNRLYMSLSDVVMISAQELAEQVVEQAEQSLEQLKQELIQLENAVADQAQALEAIKHQLHAA